MNFLKNDLDKFKLVQKAELLKPRIFEDPDTKSDSWFKNHIVKTIRGGGGNLKKYMKNKFRKSEVSSVSTALEYKKSAEEESETRKDSNPIVDQTEDFKEEDLSSSSEEEEKEGKGKMEQKFKGINDKVKEKKDNKKGFGSMLKKVFSK